MDPVFRSNNDLYRLASDAVEQLRTPGKDSSAKKSRKKIGHIKSENNALVRTPFNELRNNRNDTVGVDSAAVSVSGSGFRASFRRNKNKLKKKALNFKDSEDNSNSNLIEQEGEPRRTNNTKQITAYNTTQ